jgi:hypothetical protein
MFKRVIQSLSKSLTRQPAAPPPAKPAPAPAPAKKQEEVAPKAQVAAKPASAPMAPATPQVSPEEMCGVHGRMSKDQIRDQIKILYRRFNRAASSLDAKTRNEAEKMLDAIVTVREKYLGAI